MMILPEESASVAAGVATSDDDAVDEYLARLSSEAEGMEDNYEQVMRDRRIGYLIGIESGFLQIQLVMIIQLAIGNE